MELFREYCLSLPRGTVCVNEKNRLFNALINHWKEARPIKKGTYLGIDSGILNDGQMINLCSLHVSTASALQRFYKNVPDIWRETHEITLMNAQTWFYCSLHDIISNPILIENYYPGDNAKPILAACYFNQAACLVAFGIKRTNDEWLCQDSLALGYISAADKLVPNSRDIRSAFHTVDQVRAKIAAKKESRANELKAQRDEQDKPKKGFFAKLFGL
jgi:hypothetical protein